MAGEAAPEGREFWADSALNEPGLPDLLNANSYLDWFGPWLTRTADAPDWIEHAAGENKLWCWRVQADEPEPTASGPDPPLEPATVNEEAHPEELLRLVQWSYPHEPATRSPAKSSVTALRRKFEADNEAQAIPFATPNAFPKSVRTDRELDAADVGTAHHRFLQLVSLSKVGSVADLRSEAERLRRAGLLSEAETAVLDFEALAVFWRSEVGRKIQTHKPDVWRELPFTARFSPADLAEAQLAGSQSPPVDDFIVVQGVADLAVILPAEIWLLDFKTDSLTDAELETKADFYRPQIRLYASAFERIYRRPVTARWLHFLSVQRTVPV